MSNRRLSTARLRKEIGRVSWLSWGTGFALGALTNIFPFESFVVFGIITLIALLFWLRRILASRQISPVVQGNGSLLAPDPHAKSLVERTNERYLVVGQAIETLTHPLLGTRAHISDIGWEPDDVVLIDRQERFDAAALLDRVGGYKEFDPPNGIKYSLYDNSFVVLDTASRQLTLQVRQTDYFTQRSILPMVTQDPWLRSEFGNIQPLLNRIPHSLCLHYIVRFTDGSVLCMRRHKGTAYHSEKWSFSGEEQLSDVDFATSTAGASLFKRAFCEEVMPLRDVSAATLSERWELVKPAVDYMRLWSMFIEEKMFNFSLYGFFQLTVDKAGFVAMYNDLVNRGCGSRDDEGVFYVASPTAMHQLLHTGQCSVESLFGSSTADVKVENLHPTSRYRILRLLRAVNRRALD